MKLSLLFALIISETYYSPDSRYNCIPSIHLSMIYKDISTLCKCKKQENNSQDQCCFFHCPYILYKNHFYYQANCQ